MLLLPAAFPQCRAIPGGGSGWLVAEFTATREFYTLQTSPWPLALTAIGMNKTTPTFSSECLSAILGFPCSEGYQEPPCILGISSHWVFYKYSAWDFVLLSSCSALMWGSWALCCCPCHLPRLCPRAPHIGKDRIPLVSHTKEHQSSGVSW